MAMKIVCANSLIVGTTRNSQAYYALKLIKVKNSFVLLGLNEADTLKSSSTLIYSHSLQIIHTQGEWHDDMFIKEMKTN